MMRSLKGTPSLNYGNMFVEDPYAKRRVKQSFRLLRPYLHRGVRVLDVGCYTADILLLFPDEVDYHGVDFDPRALEIAQQRGAQVQRVDFDNQDLPFGEEEFDIVLCLEVLEHLKDPRRHLRKMREVVKKDGVVLISLPNENTLYHRLRALLGYGPDSLAFHPFKHLHLPTIYQSRFLVSEFFNIQKEVYHINVGFHSTRLEFLGKFLATIPDWFWQSLADFWPSLFARGVIFLGVPR